MYKLKNVDSWENYPLVMNSSELAQMLGVHVNTIKRLALAGEIPARRVGRNWRYNRDTIREWLSGKDIDPKS